MGKKINFSLKKFLISNWFITMFSTMFGVLAGLYLSNHFEDKNFKAAQQNALEMIKEEMRQNQEYLAEYDSISRLKYEQVAYLYTKLRSKESLEMALPIIHKDSLDNFKENTKDVMSNITTQKLESHSDSLKIGGDFNVYFNSRLALFELSNIAWNSYKETNYLDITNFECITEIETYYQLQRDFNLNNERFFTMFFSSYWALEENYRNELIDQWYLVCQYSSLLMEALEKRDEHIFINCN